MCKIDEYINSITNSLNLNKKEKEELSEEFRDHLNLLKSEYIQKGLSPEEAESEAVKSFGDSGRLKYSLSRNTYRHRSVLNVFIGTALSVFLFILGSKVPVPGLNPANPFTPGNMNLIGIVSAVLLFFPVGYFTPIFKRTFAPLFSIFIAVVLDTALGIYMNIKFDFLHISFFISYISGSMTGCLLGFIAVKAVTGVAEKVRSRAD